MSSNDPYALNPWTSRSLGQSSTGPAFVRPSNRVPARMPAPPSEKPPEPGWANLYGSLADAGDLLAAPVRALVGHPEDAASPDLPSALSNLIGGTRSDTPNDSRVLGGVADLAMALPILGGAGHAGESIIEGVKPFMSKLYETIAERAPERGIAEHFLNVARKGSKAEELSWSGLEAWLRERSGQKVARSDVLDFVRANTPDLREKMIGETGPIINGTHRPPVRRWVPDPDDLGAGNFEPVSIEQQPKFTNYTLPGGENHRELVVTMPHKDPNSIVPMSYNDAVDRGLNASKTRTNPAGFAVMNPDGQVVTWHTTEDIARRTSPTMADSGNYVVPSSHAYGDPELDVNRLMHMRFNDRTLSGPTTEDVETRARQLALDGGYFADQFEKSDFDGRWRLNGTGGRATSFADRDAAEKWRASFSDNNAGQAMNAYRNMARNQLPPSSRALHLEELQSDWHQAGRKEGYSTESTGNFAGNLQRVTQDDIDVAGNRHPIGTWMLLDDSHEEIATAPGHLTEGQARADLAEELGKRGVPDAPFKNTWHELGMRRALQEAAAGNYDRLTWTTGAQQNARYSLAQHFDTLEYHFDPDGPNFNQLIGYKKSDPSRPPGPPAFRKSISPDELPNYIGQELSDRLTAPVKPSGHEVVRGDDQFWHVKMPNGNVRARTFMRDDQAQKWIDQNFPKMNAVSGRDLEVGGAGMRGFYDQMLPAYANKFGKKYGVRAEMIEMPGGKVTGQSVRDLHDASPQPRAVNDILEEIARQVDSGTKPWHAFNHLKTEAGPAWGNVAHWNNVEQLMNTLKQSGQPVWSMRITPEMRRDLLSKSQSLFGGGGIPLPVPRRDDDTIGASRP